MLGTWVARNAKNEVRGKARVTELFGGCSVRFEWTGKTYSGAASNGYDAGRNLWQKAWNDTLGNVELSTGRITDNSVSYTGRDYQHGKVVSLHREHLTLLPDGRVLFHYEVSQDNGKTWPFQDRTYYSRISREQFDRLVIAPDRN